MEYLPTWVVTIATVVVGLSPGLALLSARPIARLLHRVRPRSKESPQPGLEAARKEPAGVAASPG